MLNLNYERVGTYWRCLRLGRALAERGHDVELLTKHRDERLRARVEEREGVRVVLTPKGYLGRVHLGEWGALDLGHRLARTLARPTDVLVAFGLAPDVALPFLASHRLRRARIHVVDRDDPYRGVLLESAFRKTQLAPTIPLLARWERAMQRRADGVTVVSEELLRDTAATGVPRERILLLPQGADVDGPVPSREEARARLRLDDSPLGVYVGSGAGGDSSVLPGVLAEVRREAPAARFAFVGPPDGIRRQLAEAAGVAGATIETGLLSPDEVRLWTAAADVLLLPYMDTAINRGRFPMKLGDFLAAGRAIVSADVGEVGRVLREVVAGVLARPDGSDFAARVVELLGDAPRAARLGANGRAAAERTYDWRLLAERFEAFLARLG